MLIASKQYDFCNKNVCNLFKETTDNKPGLPHWMTRCKPNIKPGYVLTMIGTMSGPNRSKPGVERLSIDHLFR